ncbi:MAG TPA: TonB-dependent receptor, partial [bacterium]|nr:TonB-dependent receptor [bacterium]
VLKALQALPGVITAGSLSGQLLVRGSGPSDNQYYVDNIPIGFPYHFGIVSTVDSNFVKDIDFYSSNFGPEFPNSMGGLVDLTQNEGRTDRLGFRADVNIFFAEFEVETPVTPDSSLFIAFRESYLNLLIGNFTGNQGSFEIPEFGDYQVKYSWNPSSKVHWDFQALGSADSASATLSASATVAQQDPDLAGAFNFSDGYNSQGVNFKDTSDDQNTITNTLYHTNSYFNFLIGGSYYEDTTIEDFGDKASLKHEFDSDTSLEGGIQYDHFINSLNAYFPSIPTTPNQQDNFEFTTAPKILSQDMTNSDDFSAYLDQKFKALDKKLEVSVGARLDYVNSDFTLFLTPKVSVAYHLTADTTLKAAYGYYDEAPDRIFGYPLLDANLGNPRLGPEQSIASVLGFEQKLDESGLLFRVEGYEKDLSNLIVSNPNGTPGLEYLNTGTGYARGIEFFLRQPITDRFFGWIAYSLSDSERIDGPGGPQYPYDYDEPNVITAVANYKINPGWDAGFKVLYDTGHPWTPVTGASESVTTVNGAPTTFYNAQYAATDSARLPDYFRIDFSTSIKTVYDTWEWKIYLDITNLTGVKNVLGYNYNASYTQTSAVYDLPFLPYLGVEVKY